MPDPMPIAKNAQTELCLLPALANRHGLITGATGTGKTVTLQVMAERFSAIGVPVFMADVKGDLSGITQPGAPSPKLLERLKVLGVHADGGMTERLMVPEGNLYPAGDLSLRDAAMVEFLAIGAHAVRRSEMGKGERALVVGAGPIGIGAALFSRDAGGDVTIMDISEKRLAFARDKLGFGSFILAGKGARDEAGRLTGGDYYDVVFDATGNARAMEASFGFVAHTGTLVFVGLLIADITFSDPELHKREMKLVATRNALKADFEQVMAAMRAGKVPTEAINTETIAMSELPRAMPTWLASDSPPVKAILTV